MRNEHHAHVGSLDHQDGNISRDWDHSNRGDLGSDDPISETDQSHIKEDEMTGKELRQARIAYLKKKLEEEQKAKDISCDAFEKKAIEKNMNLLIDWITEILWVDSAAGGGSA